MFEIDNSMSGEQRGLVEAKALSSEIILPFCPESDLSGVGHKDFMFCVWYKKVLNFTSDDLAGNRVIFHIGAADFETKLFVNGRKIGLPHVGGFVSFEYDITKALVEGDNVITIECFDDTRDFRQPVGKQSHWYGSRGCHYTRTTGIWQTVWYEIVPESYVKYAKLLPDLENSSVSICTELVGTGDLSAEVYYEGRLVGSAAKKNLSVTGNLEVTLSETHKWELGCGRLYDVIIRFGADEVKSYFGLRSIEMKDGKFLLNGKSVFQRLVLDQGFYPDGIFTAPTEEALIKDIECSLSAGFNGARLHQKVFEPRFLYNADRLGYMVWGEYGSWGLDVSNIANLSTFLPDWMSSVRRDFNHPSVVGWCPFNETSNFFHKNLARQDDSFLRIVYEQTKLIDPTRPCIDSSGWYHVVTDIYDLHDYEQDPAVFKENYDKLFTEGTLFDKHSENRQTWRGEPVFMSEYGGTAIGPKMTDNKSDRKSAWGYGKAAEGLEEFYERYRGLTHALLDNPRIFGFCYTQLTDVEQEQNGMFTYVGREPKADMAIISEINKHKAAIED